MANRFASCWFVVLVFHKFIESREKSHLVEKDYEKGDGFKSLESSK